MKRISYWKKNTNKGTTLVEMVMCFALMAIFVTAAAAIIATVTNLYYQVKGETYGHQISDIVMQRVVSEIEGAKYSKSDSSENPVIGADKLSIELYNRSDTRATIFVKDNKLTVKYTGFTNEELSKEDTTWKFDEKVYFGYEIEEMYFIPGNLISGSTTGGSITALLQTYGLNAEDLSYDSNIVLILLTLDSDKYGTYRTVRPVKMYNVPADYTWN